MASKGRQPEEPLRCKGRQLDPLLARLLLGGVQGLPPMHTAPPAVQRQVARLVHDPREWRRLWRAHEVELRAFAETEGIAPMFRAGGRPAFLAERVALLERVRR